MAVLDLRVVFSIATRFKYRTGAALIDMVTKLHGVVVDRSFPDFSAYPALQHPKFSQCELSLVKTISSDSFKYLSITDSISGFYYSFPHSFVLSIWFHSV